MAGPHRARDLGREIPPAMLTLYPWLSNIAHRLLHIDRLVFLYRTKHIVQHGAAGINDAVGQGLHPQGSLR
jgi:hypothetical protein